MIPEAFDYRRTYPLPRGYSIEFALSGEAFKAEWSPRVPHGRTGRALLPFYKTARHDFLSSLGVPMLVIDL